jgi:hypothetical protein
MTGTSYATMFIHFDDSGKVLFISNEVEPNIKSFEIKLDFRQGKKQPLQGLSRNF